MKDTHTFDRVKSDSDYSKLDPAELTPEQQAELDRASETVAFMLQRQFDLSAPAPVLDPVISLNGTIVATPGNVICLSGVAGSAKTRCGICGILSASLTGSAIGWTVTNPRQGAVLAIDAEQSHYHWHMRNADIATRSGIQSQLPRGFHSFPCVGESPEQLCLELEHLMTWANFTYGSVRIIVLDGFSDLIHNTNDPDESALCVRWLHDLAQRFQCVIVGVIHANEGSENVRSRGHLGAQLTRKSESVLSFSKSDNVVQCFSVKARNAPILKKDAVRWQWDPQTHNFELIDPATIKPPGPSAVFSDTLNALRKGPERMTYSQAVQCISSGCGISTKAAQARLDRGHQQGFISKLEGGFYSIIENSEL